ncbi:MAG: DUF1376 domain-containing protein [Armatimonadia bacterium]
MTISPLVPPDLDLRDFPYMPLDVVRLVDSDLTAIAEGDEFKTAVLLWCKSWHQVPASSLPDDDRMLAHLAGFGRDVKAFQKVRPIALRGFVKCSDGRLYHPVIAEKAREAGEAKQRQRARTAAATEARRKRNDAPDDQRHENRHDNRDDQRHDQRHENRNVHQGRGKGIEKGKEEDDGLLTRASPVTRTIPVNGDLFKTVERTLYAIPELQGQPVAINPMIAPIFRLVVDRNLDLETQIVPSIRRQALAAKRPLKLWSYFVDGIVQDAETPPAPIAGAHHGSQPPRRRSAGEQMRDAIDDVKAHIAGTDRSPVG